MAKRGRPTDYRPEYVELARKYCLLGATNKELAKNFDVALSTLNKWQAEIPEFSDAIKAGREEADAKVGQRLYERAMGYEHDDVHISNYQGEITQTPIRKHYAPDTTAAIFWLKNRRPDLWRDKQDIEQSGALTVNIVRFSDDDHTAE